MSTDSWGIIGHDWVVAALKRAIAADSVPHAILFVGPPGVGKRTLARTLASALDCTAPQADDRPCGQCRPCRHIPAGTYPDVHVIETERAAGTQRTDRRDISIEQIRSLQHQLSLKPYEGRWVVGIVADAHEMSDAAANCLLKTLEEPQPRAILILTAPDVGQLLPTIVSRCQVFALRPLSVDLTATHLTSRWGVAPEQAAVIARISGGRLGWAVRAVQDESILALRRQRLDSMTSTLGATRSQRLDQAALLAEDYGKGIGGREAVHETLDLWASWWRDVLLVQQGCNQHITNADRVEELQAAAQHYATADVVRSLGALITTRQYLERNANARLALEVLLLSMPTSS